MQAMQCVFQSMPQIKQTPIYVGHDLLYDAPVLEMLDRWTGPKVVIADTQVQGHIAQGWTAFCHRMGISLLSLTFAPGEGSKTREVKAHLEDALLEWGCGKEVLLIALGGGVTTDLVGYLAATFCRGVAWIAMPTSLMGMVDAALGGKTGVNTPHGKNLIGALYPPAQVFVDTAHLSSLPDSEWKNGLSEIIKYACVASPSLFCQLEQQQSAWEDRNLRRIQEWIEESIQIKQQVVGADFEDRGYRRILNFGHTVGHAVEHLMRYTISHGEAVALGISVEARYSHQIGLLKTEDHERIQSLLTQYDFSLALPGPFERLVQAMARDKKSLQGLPRSVLLEAIGQPAFFQGQYCAPLDPKHLEIACNFK